MARELRGEPPEALPPRLRSLYAPLSDLGDPPPAPLGRLYRRLRWDLSDFLFDRRLDTFGRRTELEHFHSEFNRYEPSAWWYLRSAIKRRQIRPDDVFVDFGSGLGRVLYQAARLPFRRVVGVEVSPALADESRTKLEQVRHRLRCKDVQVVAADAAAFTVPDDMTYGYFYHPFAGQTFDRVMTNIVESIDRRSRRVRLVYVCPAMEDVVLATGRFRLERAMKGGWRDKEIRWRIHVYTNEFD
jgi:predicted RNA methylase